jgi:pyruvate/2-oxoglutarate dehydrogenase complex dihydrolipoamide dehydrogenase (E3) component
MTNDQHAIGDMSVLWGTQLQRSARTSDDPMPSAEDGRTEAFDCVLFATVRVPNTAGLGLREAGVELRPSGAIFVDESFRTAVPSIHAVGDCIDRIHLTPVALAEAMVVAHRLFNKGQRDMDYSLVPTAAFSDPNVATVGLGESRGSSASRPSLSGGRPARATSPTPPVDESLVSSATCTAAGPFKGVAASITIHRMLDTPKSRRICAPTA